MYGPYLFHISFICFLLSFIYFFAFCSCFHYSAFLINVLFYCFPVLPLFAFHFLIFQFVE